MSPLAARALLSAGSKVLVPVGVGLAGGLLANWTINRAADLTDLNADLYVSEQRLADTQRIAEQRKRRKAAQQVPILPGVTPYSQQIQANADLAPQLTGYHNAAINAKQVVPTGTAATVPTPSTKKSVALSTPSAALIPYYPPNRGFFPGTDQPVMLQPGVRIDRFGRPAGTFASPEGTLYTERALPPGSAAAPYYVYEVLRPFLVKGGSASPWFGELGGGTQYETFDSFERLEKLGYVKKVKGP
jgi:hypothetical protein